MPLTRRHQQDKKWETKINHERWLVSYADFITLLFAFFVVMYSVSQVNETKYQELSKTLQASFAKKPNTTSTRTEGEPLNGVAMLANVEQQLQAALKNPALNSLDTAAIFVTGNKDSVEIALDANALFASGKAELSKDASQILSEIAQSLSTNSNEVIVSGHTDNIPIGTNQFANNWALSSARAVAVVNALAYGGVHPERLSAVGHGQYQPIADNSTEEGRMRNRRVVISVKSKAVSEPPSLLSQSGNLLDGVEQVPVSTSTSQNIEANNAENITSENRTPEIKPVRLQDGSLLFTSDPNLPRVNPVITPSPE